ncbi:lipoprotein releasing system, transmembrane protein, LolC/E family [Thalassovita gelatinovora]|uniref:Lipoprotein releasing system, transmembrane protein, LolC/E family n=1 Tax=Thalassovita gelatinovora TaxID=53501 RepID=A0A0P1G7L9_THAGE|nr:FtsX-like permease family protein [Thalassovita gelatinovora]QIZ82083.1 FtsX-like permease family protein [Thalassovita gelatinovora]CUH67623.1 lipoprotein releasing system, transmembrane protein, LolC/E family [Thalassovita gelatinovora]SEP70639.1 putative ABC transport system permease protein [Thalassovita gelatinovora]
MSLKIAARLARRELRGGLKGFRIFLACLTLGVAAIAAVGSVRAGIEAGLSREGAALLGGDAEMEFTYRFASADERAWMAARAVAVSEVSDFRSMATRGDTRMLTQVKSVDDAYPLVGAVELQPDMELSAALAGRDGLPGAVMDPLLITQMEIAVGDRFRLGTQDFVLSAALEREPDSAADGFALGPRTMVRTADLEASGLLAPGTLYSSKYRLLLPPGTELNPLKQQAMQAFEDSGLRWRDARNGAPGIKAFVDRIGAFLILVGLSGLAVGGVGVSAAVRAYLAGKTEVIATLRSLGADQRTIFQIYFLQIGALSLLGITLGLLLGAGVPVVIGPLLAAQLPVPSEFTVYPAPLIEAAIYGMLTALIFTLWPLARTGEVRAATLFRDAMAGARALPPIRYVVITLALTGMLIGAAIGFSGTWRLTLWTTGGILLSLAALALSARAIRKLAHASAPLARGRAALRWALAAIGGARDEATPVVLSLGLGLTVLAAVGQIDGNLRNAIAQDLPDKAPSFFFVDIQKDQIDGFLARLDQDKAVSRVEHAPMLRGVITRINDRPARDVAGDHWVLRGDRGITYAADRPENTKLTAGEWWPRDYSGAPLISFAADEAEEMGLRLGDAMTLNILGRDITGTIASFREVDFSTAGMGFILAMNETALAAAPHSFIATVYADEAAEPAILRDLTGAYPNITAIRVRDAIDRVSAMLDGIAAATSWGAAATLVTGFLVLIGAAAAGAPARSYEAAVLKTLGATRWKILRSFALRSALLGAAAALVALIAGISGGWAVMHFVMETGFEVIWPSALGIVLGGVAATVLAGIGFAWHALNLRPVETLRARE